MSKPTPGPWHIDQRFAHSLPHIRNSEGLYVMDAPPRSGGEHAKVRQMADARLIAAAPRMFAVIEREASQGDAECIAIVEAINGRG